jgi:predicted RecA/RadA family phage recombinase
MAQNFIQDGKTIDYVVPAGGVTSGDIVVMEDNLVGVALVTGAEDDEVSVMLQGVFDLAKASGAISAGAKVYWDADNGNVTTTTSGGSPWANFPLVGRATESVLSGATLINVKLSLA